MKLIVGQTVYRAPDSNRQNSVLKSFVVGKVGRHYAHLLYGEDKIELTTLRGSHGIYFTSVEEYEESVKLDKAWKDFRDMVDHTRGTPWHLTLDDIDLMQNMLRGTE